MPTKLWLAHQLAIRARTLELVPVDGRALLEIALWGVVVRAREDPFDLRAAQPGRDAGSGAWLARGSLVISGLGVGRVKYLLSHSGGVGGLVPGVLNESGVRARSAGRAPHAAMDSAAEDECLGQPLERRVEEADVR